MDYLLLIITALMWSFVGVLVKFSSTMVNSSVITFCRFFFGVIFLGALLLIKDRKIIFNWRSKWIWIGAIGKCCNYIFENMAIYMGFAYGNVIVWPVQAIFLALVSTLYFKEGIYPRKIAALLLCVVGVILVSFKGASISAFMESNLTTSVFFVISAVGAGVYIVSQKKLIQHMDSGNMNFNMFLLSSAITAVPAPYTFKVTGDTNIIAVFSLIALGFITGISFYLNGIVLKRVSLLVAALVSNSSVIFTLLWSWIFFKEPINIYIILGSVTFVIGIILVNLPRKIKVSNAT